MKLHFKSYLKLSIVLYLAMLSPTTKAIDKFGETMDTQVLQALILDMVMYLDETNLNGNRLVKEGCGVVGEVSHFLDLSKPEKMKWAEETSMRLRKKAFDQPNVNSPWQNTWKLDQVLERVMTTDTKCRRNILLDGKSGSAFKAAVKSSKNPEDADLILKTWEVLGTQIDPIVLDHKLNFQQHLKKPKCIPLLIAYLNFSTAPGLRDVNLVAAETLILLTGRDFEFLETEKLSASISRNPILVLRPDYLQIKDIQMSWAIWWKSAQDHIHWDPNAKFPKKLDRNSRSIQGKFVW